MESGGGGGWAAPAFFQFLVMPICVIFHGCHDQLHWPVSQTEMVLVASTGQDPRGDSASCLSTRVMHSGMGH